MDGLGGISGRNMSSLVIRFDLEVPKHFESTGSNVPSDVSPAGRSNFNIQTRPCAMNRHLFWDEQISLLIPTRAMSEQGSIASSIKVSLLNSPASDGHDGCVAFSEKPLYNFIQHVVETKDGSLFSKNERYDSVVPLTLCDSANPKVTSTGIGQRHGASGPSTVVRVRLGLMLFKQALNSGDGEDIVGRFERKKQTCTSDITFTILFYNNNSYIFYVVQSCRTP